MKLARAACLALALTAGLAWAQEKDDGYEPVPDDQLRGRALRLFDGACSLEAPEGFRWLRQRAAPATHLVLKCRGADGSLAYVVAKRQETTKDGKPWERLPDQAVKSTLDRLLRSFEAQELHVDSLAGEPCDVPLPKGASRRLVGKATQGEKTVHLRGYLWMHQGRIHQLTAIVEGPLPEALRRAVDAAARSFVAPAAEK